MSFAQLHSAVGTGAGVVRGDDGKNVPVVTMYFAKDQSVIDKLESQDADFDPNNEDNWVSYALSVRAARQLIGDLKEAVDAAIQGPPSA